MPTYLQNKSPSRLPSRGAFVYGRLCAGAIILVDRIVRPAKYRRHGRSSHCVRPNDSANQETSMCSGLFLLNLRILCCSVTYASFALDCFLEIGETPGYRSTMTHIVFTPSIRIDPCFSTLLFYNDKFTKSSKKGAVRFIDLTAPFLCKQ